MNFKDIKQWQVENGIAKPVNPYEELKDNGDGVFVYKAEIKVLHHILKLLQP